MSTKTRVYTYSPLSEDIDESELLVDRGSVVEVHELVSSGAAPGGSEVPLSSVRVGCRAIIDRSDYDMDSGVMNTTVYLEDRGVNSDGSILTPYGGVVGGVVERVYASHGESGWADETVGFGYTTTSSPMVCSGGGYTYYVSGGALYRWRHSTSTLDLLTPQTGAVAGSGTAVVNYVACSSDGSTIVVGAQDGHYPSVSFDYGSTWSAQTALSPYDDLYAGTIASDGEVLWVATQSAVYRRYRTQSIWSLMYSLPNAQLEWAQGCSAIDGQTSVWVARSRNASNQSTVGLKPIYITDTGVLSTLTHHREVSYYGVEYDRTDGALYTLDYLGRLATSTITDDHFTEHGTIPNVRRVRQALTIDNAHYRLWVLGYYALDIQTPLSGSLVINQHAKVPGYMTDWAAIAADTDGEVYCVSPSAIWRYIVPTTDSGGDNGGSAPA